MTETLFDNGPFQYSDIQPLPISSGDKDELCQILYDDEYKEVMGITRALLEKSEFSERALHATSQAIQLVPAFYTMWNYRFQIVRKLYGADPAKLNDELDWLDQFTLNNPKNYQIWSYRQALLKLHPSPQFLRELPILQAMLDEDTKNYHVWSYRRSCVFFFQNFDHELQFASDLITRDVYNNSAWCHRMFVLKSQFKPTPPTELLKTEIHYTKTQIELAPQNISSWNYLQGLYQEFLDNKFDAEVVDFALTFTSGAFDSLEKPSQILSSYALEFLAHVYGQSKDTSDKACRAYRALSEIYDPIRKNFWNFKIRSLTT
ncbi:LANO_0F17260g1_1 [Lachancea nothofagi CBS 11611]|uniref:Protein farnesyltransferase/geranylgeranyltransferase type-1 subunit alpha n=1 Tax=Lachancea nothofagi CBS 11611 TaxID=1266666 RepID=A0A1G4KD29_9SACH|nr:LANO_0F17260g1_1 [Lachancea nothofagi CBS 11611]